ncbi:MAG: arginine repressor [Chloroflexi bacterium]|nr:arginine repressor [Chloroflexota bacterium]
MRGRPNAVQHAGGGAENGANGGFANGSFANGTVLAGHRGSSVADVLLAGAPSKRDRQRAIREIVATGPIGSQLELVERLTECGFAVTQATVSRDIAELGLLKAPRFGGHSYVVPEFLAGAAGPGGSATPASDERLRRILADVPVTIGRSGLILLVTGSPGTASIIAQAIDESSLTEQEGTLAGDNTLLVLFADEARLGSWRERFDVIRTSAVTGSPGGPLSS